MKVHSVKLVNYRSHRDDTFYFEDGINLLLGPNGSGKSSILEAIGLALFDASPRSSNNMAVSNGQKAATIEVNFSADDGKRYIVERRLGSGAYIRLRVEGDDLHRLQGSKEVYGKMAAIARIKGDAKSIYQTVITAEQNKITEVFAGTDAVRRNIFNTIFDTDVYDRMFRDYAKKAVDKINTRLEAVAEHVRRLESSVEDTEPVQNEIEQLKAGANDIKGKIKAEEQKRVELKNTIDNQQKTENELNVHREKLSAAQNSIEDGRRNLEASTERLEQARSAEQKVAELKPEHEKYAELNTKAEEQQKTVDKLDKQHKKFLTLEKQSDKAKADISKMETSLAGAREMLGQYTNVLEETIASAAELEEKLENLEKEGKESAEQAAKFSEKLSAYQESNSSLSKIDLQIQGLKARIDALDSDKKDIAQIEKELSQANINKQELHDQKISRDKLSEILQKYRARLEETISAETELAGGKCPILQEDCLNMQNAGNPESYFTQRRSQLESSITRTNEELSEYRDLDDKISTNMSLIKSIGQEKSKQEQMAADREEKSDRLRENQAAREVQLKNIMLIFETTGIECAEPENITEAENKLRDLSANANSRQETLRKQYTDISAELKKIQAKQKKTDKSIKGQEKQIKALNSDIDLTRGKLEQAGKDMEAMGDTAVALEAAKQYAAGLSAEIKELAPLEQEYIRLREKAAGLDSWQKEVSQLEKYINEKNGESAKIEQIIERLQKSYDKEKLESAIMQKAETEQLTEQLKEQAHRNDLRRQEPGHIIDRQAELARDIKKGKTEAGALQKKYEMGQYLRDKFRSMGKLVAGRMLESVAYLATENFRSITARSESIIWVNDESKAYQVYLVDEHGMERPFDVLSGGEQVSVALSIRAAMARRLTGAEFAIFDEPTNNLDQDRKTLLATYLGKILEGLRQAIIVTHDDSFTDMAGNVIQLSATNAG